jgi:hypothetical protein
MKPETHVDLEEMRSDVTNCHPHPIGFGREQASEQQKSSREAEVDLDQRPWGRTAMMPDSRSASYPGAAIASSYDFGSIDFFPRL